MAGPLRLVVYDATQQTRPPVLLGLSWNLGSRLYRAAGRVDASYGASSFADMFAWLSSHEPDRAIEQIQFWGHGKWGRVFIDRELLDHTVCRLAPRAQVTTLAYLSRSGLPVVALNRSHPASVS